MKVTDINNKVYTAEPIYIISNNMVQTIDADLPQLGLKFTFPKIDPETHKVDIAISESKNTARDFVVMKATVFHYIIVLWLGCVIMVIGTTLAIRQRIIKNREAKKEALPA